MGMQLVVKMKKGTVPIHLYLVEVLMKHITLGRRQSKPSKPATNGAKKIIRNRVFDCHLTLMGDKWQLKTLFLAIFDQRLSIVKSVFNFRLPGVYPV